MREESIVEGAFQARHKWKTFTKDRKSFGTEKPEKLKEYVAVSESSKKGKTPFYNYCQRNNHWEKDCRFKG